MQAKSQIKVESIQILRAVAALLVVVDHALHGLIKVNSDYQYLNAIASQLGRFGVLVFFVISGYIMVVTSYDETGRKTTWNIFLWSRIRRIVPLYWLMTAFVAIFSSHHAGSSWGVSAFVQSMLFLPISTPDGWSFTPIIGAGWTLYYEMAFYAACFSRP